MKNKFHKIVLDCLCGCGALEVSRDDDGNVELAYKTDATGVIDRLKAVWTILTGNQYCFFEILISDPRKLQEFKNFVANIPDVTNEQYD